MVNENLVDRKFIPSQPYDPEDLPRFSQLNETAKDAFAYELREFFDYLTADGNEKISVIPNIQKFSMYGDPDPDSLETVVTLIQAYADTPDQFPMVSITATSQRERKMNLGDNFVSAVQYPPSIVGTELGPFDFSTSIPDGQDYLTLKITTWPNGREESATESTISFSHLIFADWSNVTMDELVEALNKSQALYYTCSKTSQGYLRISCGGPCAVTSPNYIEVTGGDSQLLNKLGFTLGSSDTYLNTDNPPRNRNGVAADMTINIDVIGDSLNTRTELADLIFSFFTFYLEKRRFQIFGRSYFERGLDPEEWYHISINNQFSWSTETTQPRQGGEQYDQIYAVRGSVPIFIEDFIDKKIVTPPVFLERDRITNMPIGFPVGDYGGVNYLKNL